MREFLEALMPLMTKVQYAECTIITNQRGSRCPLCQALIQPNVTHTCSRKNTPVKPRRARKAAK